MLLEKEATPLETVRDLVGGSRIAGIGAEVMGYFVQMGNCRVFAGPVEVDSKVVAETVVVGATVLLVLVDRS